MNDTKQPNNKDRNDKNKLEKKSKEAKDKYGGRYVDVKIFVLFWESYKIKNIDSTGK